MKYFTLILIISFFPFFFLSCHKEKEEKDVNYLVFSGNWEREYTYEDTSAIEKVIINKIDISILQCRKDDNSVIDKHFGNILVGKDNQIKWMLNSQFTHKKTELVFDVVLIDEKMMILRSGEVGERTYVKTEDFSEFAFSDIKLGIL